MSSEKSFVACQEIIRLKCEARSLIIKIADTCGFNQHFIDYYHSELRFNNEILSEKRKKLLDLLYEHQIPLVYIPGKVETVDQICKNNLIFANLNDGDRARIFDVYLKYNFTYPIVDEIISWNLLQAHREVVNALKQMLRDVLRNDLLTPYLWPKRRKYRPTTSRLQSNTREFSK